MNHSLFRNFTVVSALVALAFPGVRAHAAPLGLDISEAQDFNLLTWGNATFLNSDTEGRAAVGGNATFNSYSIGTHATVSDPLTGVLLVGGNLTAGDGQVFNGSIYVGGSYSGPGYNLNSAAGSVTSSGVGKTNLPFDFAAAQTALTAKSLAFGSETANGTSLIEWSTLTLTGTDASLNIFTIDAATLAAASTLTINVTAGSQVLINVSGTAVNFGNMGINGTFNADDTLFNFFDATSLTMSSIGIEGSILAPLADVTFLSGQMNGQLIANSFGGAAWGVGELHNYLFNNQTPPPSVPDSTNTAGLLLGALALGGLALQRFGRASRN
jgi:choice-of-anchor A domain-containing protein